MAMVDVGSEQPIGWPGLRVGGRLGLPYIRQMYRVNSHSDYVTMTTP